MPPDDVVIHCRAAAALVSLTKRRTQASIQRRHEEEHEAQSFGRCIKQHFDQQEGVQHNQSDQTTPTT
jgi:hypothetical protein